MKRAISHRDWLIGWYAENNYQIGIGKDEE